MEYKYYIIINKSYLQLTLKEYNALFNALACESLNIKSDFREKPKKEINYTHFYLNENGRKHENVYKVITTLVLVKEYK